jgi:hypothetical protein
MVTWVPGQRLHRLGEHVGGVVADQLQRPGVVAIDELDFGVAIDELGEIDDRAVERHGDGALGERRRNRLGHFEAGDAIGVIPTRRRKVNATIIQAPGCSLAAHERR